MDEIDQDESINGTGVEQTSVNEVETDISGQQFPKNSERNLNNSLQGDKPIFGTCEDSSVKRNVFLEDVEGNKRVVFKKPLLIVGPQRGKSGGKVKSIQPTDSVKDATSVVEDAVERSSESNNSLLVQDISSNLKTVSNVSKPLCVNPSQKLKENSVPVPYKEPSWSGIPDASYSFEVLKDGKIIENIDLVSKPYFVIGRLSTCDIQMAHPTISRHHAVMQYRKEGSEQNSVGFYVYDLGSTHGTFLNKYRIRSNIHIRIQVGHMLKFGNSTRMFILQGPESDQEQESALSITELKEKRRLEEEEREQQEHLREMEEQTRKELEEEEGIDWGMGEDADEETDLSENPFATTLNEELYIDDPKKTLRGWFEREGYELEYNVEQKSFGQFLCRVELPIGNGVIAEALVKGKKKEAVVQCALEACRILDRSGLLRQATHESRKRKAKNWEDDDFYDSDEDTFLDRTGAVEKKRQQRMQAAGKLQQEADTYETLIKKYNDVHDQLKQIQKEYNIALQKVTSHNSNESENDEDALDAYMTQLSSGIVDKKEIFNLKSQLQALQSEEDHLRKLVNIAKPAALPDLVPVEQLRTQTSNKAALVAAVKRKVKANQMSKLPSETKPKLLDTGQVEEEEEEDEEEEEVEKGEEVGDRVQGEKEENNSNRTSNCNKDKNEPKVVGEKYKESVPVNTSGAHKIQIAKPLDGSNGGKENCGSASGSRQQIIGPTLPPSVDLSDMKDGITNKQRKRSRPKQKKDRIAKADEKSYDYDESDPDYSIWLPPENQSGDGRTKLNEKYGY